MINQLITDIYETTLKMEQALKAEKFTEFEKLLESRQKLMLTVEEYRNENTDFTYSDECKRKLASAFELDQCLSSKLEEQKEKTGVTLNQIKKKKQVSQKYMPYMKQNYGAFIDTNK